MFKNKKDEQIAALTEQLLEERRNSSKVIDDLRSQKDRAEEESRSAISALYHFKERFESSHRMDQEVVKRMVSSALHRAVASSPDLTGETEAFEDALRDTVKAYVRAAREPLVSSRLIADPGSTTAAFVVEMYLPPLTLRLGQMLGQGL